MNAEIEVRLAVLEANNLAVHHALAAVFTAIAELDFEIAARIPAQLSHMIPECGSRGGELAATALENIAELAVMAVNRAR